MTSKVLVPEWLTRLRQAEIVNVVNGHSGTHDDLRLGVPFDEIRNHVICGGQADFDLPYKHLRPYDRCVLYAYVNQLGHLEELYEALGQIFAKGRPRSKLIVLDIGCGPFTGGLAFAAAAPDIPFTYIGLDRSNAMRDLGENLARAAEEMGVMNCSDRQWGATFNDIHWTRVPGWRPVLVIVSYLLASTTLDLPALIGDINAFCARVGRGPVTILYTNATSVLANQGFDDLRIALEGVGFCLKADEEGLIAIKRFDGFRERRLRYALFQRQTQNTLDV